MRQLANERAMRGELETSLRSLRKETERLQSVANTRGFYIIRIPKPNTWRSQEVKHFVRGFFVWLKIQLRTLQELFWPHLSTE